MLLNVRVLLAILRYYNSKTSSNTAIAKLAYISQTLKCTIYHPRCLHQFDNSVRFTVLGAYINLIVVFVPGNIGFHSGVHAHLRV
jgi:hypothetical protein